LASHARKVEKFGRLAPEIEGIVVIGNLYLLCGEVVEGN